VRRVAVDERAGDGWAGSVGLDVLGGVERPVEGEVRDVFPSLAGESEVGSAGGVKAMMAYALIGLAMTGDGGAEPGWSAGRHGAAGQALAGLGVTVEPLEGRLAGLDRQRLRAVMGAGRSRPDTPPAAPSPGAGPG
jgi:hypothetical protein